MIDIPLSELDRAFQKCSDCLLHPEYISLLNNLYNMKLSKDYVDYTGLWEGIVVYTNGDYQNTIAWPAP